MLPHLNWCSQIGRTQDSFLGGSYCKVTVLASKMLKCAVPGPQFPILLLEIYIYLLNGDGRLGSI